MSIFLTANSAFAINKKIVVVGAGIAGLTTAYRLQQGGMDVDLYEARSRVGGRILTVSVNDSIVELGAQNINDGGEAIYLRKLIDELGLEVSSSRVGLDHFYYNGENLTPVNQLLKDKKFDPFELRNRLDELKTNSNNIEEVLERLIEKDNPLYKVTAARLAAYEGGSIEKLSPIYIETLYHTLTGGTCSAHPGSRNEEDYVDFESIKDGNAKLTEKIAKSLGTRLHSNMPLTKVRRNRDGSFKLTFLGNNEINADILVLAIPCSVYENIAFENEVIPTDKLEIIKNIQYGQNAKIVVPFPNVPPKAMILVSDKIISFLNTSTKLLTAYYIGNASLFSEKTILKRYLKARPMIEMGYGSICPTFINPSFANDQHFVKYSTPVGYSWPNDPYAKGTYSYISPGQEDSLMTIVEENGEQFKTLFSPIQNLYFAGEHASTLFDVPGTMEAACESGERVARAILKVYL